MHAAVVEVSLKGASIHASMQQAGLGEIENQILTSL